MDGWQTKNIVFDGGLNTTADLIEHGSVLLGMPRELINYEPAENRGYRRILGYTEYDETVVPGETNAPVIGVQPWEGRVIAVRATISGTPDMAIYTSSGSGWTKINDSARSNTNSSRARFAVYNITEPVITIVDGENYAAKWNGTSYTTINGDGAPTDPAYAVEWKKRLVLSGYGDGGLITLSSPNDDEDYDGANGAIEISVGDTVVGLKSFRDILYIFCQNSIKRLSGNTDADFVLSPVTEKIGCIDGDTIQEVAGDIVYLGPDGFRSLTATQNYGDVELALICRQIAPLVTDMIALNPSRFMSVALPNKAQYRCFYYQDGVADDAQKGFIGKYKPTELGTHQWSEIQGMPVYSAGSIIDTDNSTVVVFGHAYNGKVYRMESSGGFNGEPIPFSLKTAPLTFDDINIRKVIQRLRTVCAPEQGTSFSARVILNEYYNDPIQPASKIIDLSNNVVLFDDPGLVFADTDGQPPVFQQDVGPSVVSLKMEGAGYTITIQYTGSNNHLPHRIDSMTIEFGPKARR